jgi:hypothetical protein
MAESRVLDTLRGGSFATITAVRRVNAATGRISRIGSHLVMLVNGFRTPFDELSVWKLA